MCPCVETLRIAYVAMSCRVMQRARGPLESDCRPLQSIQDGGKQTALGYMVSNKPGGSWQLASNSAQKHSLTAHCKNATYLPPGQGYLAGTSRGMPWEKWHLFVITRAARSSIPERRRATAARAPGRNPGPRICKVCSKPACTYNTARPAMQGER